ncbi:MAG TPA: 3-phosphoshikimate 1-carboxyvinyltransferase [Acidimicrobiia bacterium]|nr:3-phosphoshikimate 1-carboxyvinyltransferase [Acidimicrobiia bacterium]
MSVARAFSGPRHGFVATAAPPGDKSLSHRALILAAMAPGRSRIAGLGTGSDVAATAWALGRFGVRVDRGLVESRGIEAWTDSGAPIDTANSGSTMRMLAGAVAGRPFVTRLTGDPSLLRRPMRRLVAPLGALGAVITTSRAGTAPLTVAGGPLVGTAVWIPEASAQVRTAVALAALQATGTSSIDSPPGFRDHTERWLESLGLGHTLGPTTFEVRPGPVPPLELTVPADPSSAAFLWTAAALTDGEVTTRGVSLNPGRTGLLDVLAAMGASVVAVPRGDVLGDPVGDVTVRGPVRTGIDLSAELTVRTLDELPLVALLATVAEGATTVTDAAELRFKESDRIAATATMLAALGGKIVVQPDGFTVHHGPLHPGAFFAGADHRMAMAAAVAATVAGTVTVVGIEAAGVSWPEFADTLETVWSSR